ncbi:hypothetical protein SLEP1_g4051 [Rubroshorea leprosula]|uniref:Uncharacterized protein n=1 Tax=Rubroshorea leprosula TaxID=152421 RepID=A0AAV5HW98_9ROSI|nr:hypothetical protein SLEP1_g4051 [Rubroshorea leprosula]
MGSACCVAARERTIPSRTQSQPLHRNITCSPSWSFRWDNRRRVAGEIQEPSYQGSHGISRDVSMEMKGVLGSGRGNLSDQGSPLENYGTPTSEKSPAHEGGRNLLTPHSGISCEFQWQIIIVVLVMSMHDFIRNKNRVYMHLFCSPSFI